MSRSVLLALPIVGTLVASTAGATMYVGVNGIDGPGCGTKAAPCRSITRAVDAAAAGDTVIVGPGRYGNIDNTTLGDPGDEAGFPFCGCVLGIDKPITLLSSAGAGATVIDARTVSASRTVTLVGAGITFGKPGKGFTVTRTADDFATGLFIVGADVKVSGNQFVGTGDFPGVGIHVGPSNDGPTVIEANQVMGWSFGMRILGPSVAVRKNKLSLNGTAIETTRDSSVTGNVAVANETAIFPSAGRITGNALVGNRTGIELFGGSPTITKNNIMGGGCGIRTESRTVLSATDNYWGAPTGPGPDPADLAGTTPSCNRFGTTVTSTPFATKPFSIKAKVQP